MARKTPPTLHLVPQDEPQQQSLRARHVTPVQLQPIPWGTRDATLGRGVCQHVEDATPPVVITFNPFTHNRVRRVLRSLGVAH